MLQILFHPESNKQEYIDACKVYSNMWKENSERIIQLIEATTGLTFKTSEINAVVYEGPSYSHPMHLRASYSDNHKKATIIHELLHVLFVDNHLRFNDSLEGHKTMNLVLYDIWVALEGEGFAEEAKNRESNYHNPMYKEAWEWALSYSSEERIKKFISIRESHYD